ncbi:VG15 protein [Nocardia xishanensis]
MLTAALRALHKLLGAALASIIRRRMAVDGVPVTVEQRQQMARVLHREVVVRRQRSHQAAREAIREFDRRLPVAPMRDYPVAAVERAIERATEPPQRRTPQPAATPRRSRARVTVRAAPAELDPETRRRSRARVTGPTPENRTDPVVVREVAERVSATLARHVQQAARDTIADTAEAAGEEIGWARVLSGAESCAFCAMLASRGPVYRSDKSATSVVGRRGRPRGSRNLGEAYHDHCDCEAILVRRGEDWEGREEYERLERLWMAADSSGTGEETRKVFGRAFRRIERDPELGEEIEQLWADSTEGLIGGEALRAFRRRIKENPPAALEAARRPRRATTDE